MILQGTVDDGLSLLQSFKRDKDYILSQLVETGDKRLIVKRPLEIHYPEEYMAKTELFAMGDFIKMLGMFAIVDPETKTYALFQIPARVYIPISQFVYYKYQDRRYAKMKFNKGDTLLLSTAIEVDDKIEYWIYDFFIAVNHVPWYMTYEDVLTMYDLSYHHVGLHIASISQLYEMIFANAARNPNNEEMMYRGILKDKSQLTTYPPKWSGLKNITLGPADTFSKVMGSYYDDGLNSSLVSDSAKLTEIEKVLRA